MENVQTASGAQLNNDVIQKILEDSTPKQEHKIEIIPPSDTLVDLPAGYINSEGEVVKAVEVRELNGKDEEAIGKLGSAQRAYGLVLERATVKVGSEKATESILNSLLLGDRDAIMLGIYRATFGSTPEMIGICNTCDELKAVEVDLDKDVTTKILADPIADRTFTVEGRRSTFLVTLPTGLVQKELLAAEEKSAGEKTTILLQHCVLEIDEKPVFSKAQVQELGVMDRNILADEINKRLPGPQFEDLVLDCSDCEGGKVVVPFNLGALFRL